MLVFAAIVAFTAFAIALVVLFPLLGFANGALAALLFGSVVSVITLYFITKGSRP